MSKTLERILRELKEVDPEVYEVIKREERRQEEVLELIASENASSKAVMQAMMNVMTNKYAEGYPGKRYYGGCEYVDVVEQLAIDRVKQLFSAEHANVQPHSGAQANLAVFYAFLKPGDTILSMSLAHGGHLTHGSPVSLTGSWFNVVHYTLREDDQLLDYDSIRQLAHQYKPKLIIAGSSSYSRVIDFKEFRRIADEVGAYLLSDVAHYAGLIAAGVYPTPVPYSHAVTFTTHKTMRGPRGGAILTTQEYAKDIDKAVFPGTQGGPLMHIIAAKAVAFKEAMTEDFKEYQRQVLNNSRALAKALQDRGYKIVSGGTDCHMFMIDLRSVDPELTGKEAEEVLMKANIVVNKNAVPFDTRKPFIASGIRIGTPTVTTRGMKEKEMEIIADLIDTVIRNRDKEPIIKEVKEKVLKLTKEFPLYGDKGIL